MALVTFRLADRTAGFEGLGDLVVQLDAIGHDYECPVAGNLPKDLLREEHHGETLARALRLPEYAAPSVPLFTRFQRCGDGIIHAEELMILPQHFHQPVLVL